MSARLAEAGKPANPALANGVRQAPPVRQGGGPADRGKKPALAWLPVARLTVDPQYQRDTGSRRSQKLIETIAGNFRWSRFGVVLAVKHGKGWHVIEGQHRVEAARACGDIETIPAVVLPHATLEAAAADFVAINRDRVTVTPLHIHHAMLAARDPVALSVDWACRAAGVTICRYPIPSDKIERGHTLAIGCITRLVRLKGEAFVGDVLTRVLRLSKEADAVNAAAIRYVAAQRGGAARDAAPARLVVSRKRACLGCGKPFTSEGAHNRMCASCKTSG